MKKSILFLALGLMTLPIMAQKSNKVIAKSDPSIISWAKGVEVNRGTWSTSGENKDTKVTYGNVYDAIGEADAGNLRCVSLGNGGSALVTFDRPIINDYGCDFVVFENAFDTTFLELAFVEVSSDGVNFFRFPCASAATDDKSTQIPFNYTNLAGNTDYNYGTGFDLDDIQDNELLDKNNIRFVRLIDIISGQDKDTQGNLIYDAVSENTYSAGFDLAGIGVINGREVYTIADFNSLLTEENTYDLISLTNYDTKVYDEDMEMDYYYKNYRDNGLNFVGYGYYIADWYWFMAMGFSVSNIGDTAGLREFDKYYYAASMCGLEGNNSTYTVGYYSPSDAEHTAVYKEDSSEYYPQGVYVNQTLSSYEYADMSYKESDWFKLTATGYDAQGNKTAETEIYFIDMREDESGNKLGNVTTWRYLDLSALGKVQKVVFTPASTDSYTPYYFCLDNFVYTDQQIEKVVAQKVEVSACDSYEIKGHTFTETGTYGLYDTILDLTVNPSYTDTINAELTDSAPTFEFNGTEYDKAGDYTVTLQTVDGCDSVFVLHITSTAALTDAEAISISIYPNPATDYTVITAQTGAAIEITDINGRLVRKITAQSDSTEIKNLDKGSYFVTVKTADKQTTRKLIIK
ncbi:MAG: DUF4465 domain-containing protein [Bacteroidales bacterium]|nr:DUF4465 domain-containing protein [Bacteroidales bacterium]